MKNKSMKKNGFLTGAFIATFGIVFTKFLGVLYVIPFHAIIGDKGGALYGYAYTIYLLFMSLSSAGIPLAISKIISEYQTLGYYNAKRRAFIIGKKIAILLGVICFLILSIFAPIIAKGILGNITGGNSIDDVCFVIRVIATAILIVPILSIYRGYFEGHRFMVPPSFSQILEQLVRVFIIIFGSFLCLKVFKISLTSAVGIALFGATVGAFSSYIYLFLKKRKNSSKFNRKILDVNEPIITDKQILKKIVIYAIPFIMIDVFKSLYNYIDMMSVVKNLVNIANYSIGDAEIVYSMLSTWCAKFNMIIISISTGIVVSLIPNLTVSYVKRNKKDINYKINQAFKILIFFVIPMTFGISFLSGAIWNLFYGVSKYGSNVLSYYIFVALFMSLFTTSISIIQILKDYKTVFISLVVGVLFKLLLNTNLMVGFYKMGLPSYYGCISATIIGYLVSFCICMIVLNKKFKINFNDFIVQLMNVLCNCMIMCFALFIIHLFIPKVVSSRILNIFVILFYTVVGGVIYLLLSYVSGNFKSTFGKNNIKEVLKIMKNKKSKS